MLQCEPKLKRGLKDVSPLFKMRKEPGTVKPGKQESALSSMALLNVASPFECLGMTMDFARHLSNLQHSCAAFSLSFDGEETVEKEQTVSCFKIHLNWKEFNTMLKLPPLMCGSNDSRFDSLFFPLDFRQVHYYPDIFPLLDNLILITEPTVEALLEAYKVIKGTIRLNPVIQHFVVFKKSNHFDPSFLFERFSSILARHLRINVIWLGYAEEHNGTWNFSAVSPDNLFDSSRLYSENPSKLVLADIASKALTAS